MHGGFYGLDKRGDGRLGKPATEPVMMKKMATDSKATDSKAKGKKPGSTRGLLV